MNSNSYDPSKNLFMQGLSYAQIDAALASTFKIPSWSTKYSLENEERKLLSFVSNSLRTYLDVKPTVCSSECDDAMRYSLMQMNKFIYKVSKPDTGECSIIERTYQKILSNIRYVSPEMKELLVQTSIDLQANHTFINLGNVVQSCINNLDKHVLIEVLECLHVHGELGIAYLKTNTYHVEPDKQEVLLDISLRGCARDIKILDEDELEVWTDNLQWILTLAMQQNRDVSQNVRANLFTLNATLKDGIQHYQLLGQNDDFLRVVRPLNMAIKVLDNLGTIHFGSDYPKLVASGNALNRLDDPNFWNSYLNEVVSVDLPILGLSC